MRTVREKRPLVLHVTNAVTVNDCANVTLCTGGSPVMSEHRDDASELAASASAVVINIGTVKACTLSTMIGAGKAANDAGVPVILDPVGVSATRYRRESVAKIINEVEIAVIKGNAGEISFLAGKGGEVRGVDSCSEPDGAAAASLAEEAGAIVGMSGSTDYVSDGKTTFRLSNGSPLMDRVSGTGCMLSSVVGCYAGACGVSAESVAAAMSVFSVAGEIAADSCSGPGSFRAALMDSLSNLTEDDLLAHMKAEIL